MSLCTKTTALLAAIVFLVLASASVVALRYQERSIEHTIFDGVDGQAQVAARGIAAFVEESLTEAAAVAATLPAEALAEKTRDGLEAHLARMLRVFPKFQNGIFVLDRDGKFLADFPAHPELRGESFAFREYFQRTVTESRGVVATPYRSKRTNRPVLTFTAPVRDATGRLVAIVACSVDLLSREALGGYREQRYGKTGYLYVFDRSRLLVLHPDDERQLTRVEEGKNKGVEAALRGFEGASETLNSKGVPMLLAVRRIPGTEWMVGVQATRREAFRPIAEVRTQVLAASAVAVLLVILIGGLAIRRVSRPLQQLERAALQIGAEIEGGPRSGGRADGALASLERIRSRDEIGRLASSFRGLAARLDDRNRLEQELRQAQKMEAVGQLANGVAHDFNNMLAVILGAGRYVRDELPPDDPLRGDVEEILGTAGRAAMLTRQLLDFSRRQAIEPQIVDLGEGVRGAEKMLRRLVAEGVELKTVTPPTPCLVRADPSQIDQVIVNLAVNARDAMPAGGRLTIEVAQVDADDPDARHEAPLAGPLVKLSTSDTGVGMDEATVARIFDPFFTTKDVGQGTGLGLSTVYGIVQQCGGAVRVTSEPGKGTTFRIYLPRVVPETARVSRPATCG